MKTALATPEPEDGFSWFTCKACGHSELQPDGIVAMAHFCGPKQSKRHVMMREYHPHGG